MSSPLPPLEGVDPAWSRIVHISGDSISENAGRSIGVHVLDSWHHREGVPDLTVLCVHGNPTWSYLWRRVLAEAPARWRVVAIDHVGMGYSDRVAGVRRLSQRVDDLGAVTAQLNITGPVVTVAHDWGGPISLGWALAHRDQLVGVVLTNTAVSQPPGTRAPSLIRAARTPGVLPAATVRTSAFLRGALRLGPTPKSAVPGFVAPYATADRRRAIGDFVADIPLVPEHPSWNTLTNIAEGVRSLDVPTLLMWGTRDPVFGDAHLRDLIDRNPSADVQCYPVSHLVTEQEPLAIPTILRWITLHEGVLSAHRSTQFAPDAVDGERHPQPRRDLLCALRERRDDETTAVAELSPAPRSVSWKQLAERVDRIAAGLIAAGVQPSDRVALLVPPGADLLACAYACWRIGAVVVAADAGLGPRGIARAIRGAAPDHLIAVPRGQALIRAARISIPGLRITVGKRALGASMTLADVEVLSAPMPPSPAPDADAAVVFTSGATGPAKAVVYRHAALEAQRDILTSLYSITDSDALVAGFGPWVVLGPALGIASAVPDVDPMSSGSLTAAALADAAATVKATLVWASPAALRSALNTQGALSPLQRQPLSNIRLLMSASAPVSRTLLDESLQLFPNAQAHTPYGMTEVVPVADISRDELIALPPGDGVCVGLPVAGVRVLIATLEHTGAASTELTNEPMCMGEIVVQAPHAKAHYDRLWGTDAVVAQPEGWHRTGDVGHLDDAGRLWIEGRVAHVITTDAGPITPVPVEQRVEGLSWVSAAAAVGIGPVGTQHLVIVVVTHDAPRRGSTPLATLQQHDEVRALAPTAVAVLVRSDLPVDSRHNSKINRTELAMWATSVLAGESR